MEYKETYRELVKFPMLVGDQGSLTPTEKSLLGHFILLARPRLIIELGVFRGVTTQFICEFLHENEIDAKVLGFDLPDVVAELRKTNTPIRNWEETSRLQLIPGQLPTILENWLCISNEPVDFALVDANHSYGSVIGELRLLWPRLSENGYIFCHDYSSKHEGVQYAVDRFAAKQRAMVLSLNSSSRARDAGHTSVLVALCHHPYKVRLSRLWHHFSLKAKSDLLKYSILRKMWENWVRPVLRRGDR